MPPTLLLADGSLTIRRVIELTFADENVRVIAVGDGGEAIARIEAEPPDIVLADIGMPAPSGYEVAEFVKRDPRFAHIPVLLLTGAFEPVDAARARAIGCEGVLVKPFEPQLVISRVRELLKGGESAAAAAASLSLERKTPAALPGGDDDYFDRLDAAFATMGGAPPAADPIAAPKPAAAVPEVKVAPPSPPPSPSPAPARQEPMEAADQPIARTPPTVARPSVPVAAAPVEAAPPPQPVSLAAAFSALLTAERGHVFNPSEVSASALPPSVIDDIATRVIERIGDDVMRQAVLDAAERLVNEEIARIKTGRPSRP